MAIVTPVRRVGDRRGESVQSVHGVRKVRQGGLTGKPQRIGTMAFCAQHWPPIHQGDRIVVTCQQIVQCEDVRLDLARRDNAVLQCGETSVGMAYVTPQFGRNRRHGSVSGKYGAAGAVACGDDGDLIRPNGKRVNIFSERNALGLKVVAYQVHRSAQTLSRKSDIRRKRLRQIEQVLCISPEIRFPGRVNVPVDAVLNRDTGRDDLRWIAHFDDLRPEIIVRRQHGEVLEIRIVTVHPEVVPRKDDVGPGLGRLGCRNSLRVCHSCPR